MLSHSLIWLLFAISLAIAQAVSAETICRDERAPGEFNQRFSIAEGSLPAVVSIFNAYGSDIPATQVPDSIAQINSQEQGRVLYFDTETMTLLTAGSSVQLNERLRYGKTSPTEVIFSDKSRQRSYAARDYRRKLTPLDKHPLLGSIKRSDRSRLQEDLRHAGVETPLLLKPALAVHYHKNSHIVRKYSVPLLEVSFISYETSAYGIPAYHHEIELTTMLCQNDIVLTDEEIAFISQQAQNFESKLFQNEAATLAVNTPYKSQIRAAAAAFPLLVYTIQYPLLTKLVQALLLATFGGLILYFVIRQ